MNEYYKFNLNDHFLVKLTEKGYQFVVDYWNQPYKMFPDMKGERDTIERHIEKTNKNGYYEFQAHEFMSIFGETLNGSFGCPYFETNILIRKSELK